MASDLNAVQQEQLCLATFFRSEGRLDDAMRIANEILNEKFDCPEAIFLVGHCLLDSGKNGLAHALYTRFLQLKPNVSAGWNNLGRCYRDNHRIDEAERCFRRALKLDKDDAIAMSNLGLVHLERAEPEAAIEWSTKAVTLEPQFTAAKHNLGLAHLMNHQWVPGWEYYEASVNTSADRRERIYRDEDRWDGTRGKCVVAYGEQGIGDEISFASCIPDLVNDCRETVIECDSRLEGLFQRSFPLASVHGTRYREMIDWADQHKVEARVAFGSLPKFYRTSDADFDGEPYLVADPQRRLQWRSLLASLGSKLKVGISWQGGIRKTGKAARSVSLEDMLPILRQDATFISLQYKNSAADIEAIGRDHGIEVHHWKRAAEAQDYDETAALVAELDVVISVTTAVIHLAGGLGKQCIVLTPKRPMWRYGLQGDKMPWYRSVELIRQQKPGNWVDPISEAAYRLRDLIRVRNDHQQLHDAIDLRRRVA